LEGLLHRGLLRPIRGFREACVAPLSRFECFWREAC
jgi:hypothetical protein